MKKIFFSVHGHFYQPPRVDPRTGKIPQEIGSQPYENWTARIHDECYLPNAEAGNFEKISFNFGPTLTAWLSRQKPETLAEIVRQENNVYARLGVSNAIAQPYIHAIMPLMRKREKEVLVRWGIADYVHRFGHAPQGMWLPETAVDLETLDVLADNDIQFTILAPWQAKDPSLDITQPYRVSTPSGKSVTVFFYNSFLSSELSFNTSASMDAYQFVDNWLIPQAQTMAHDHDQLFVAASDGELYGHHMKEREQFLAYLFERVVSEKGFTPAFPAQWLRTFPPAESTEINENTSWSCHHGIERWKNECGDAPNAFWKAPLREFLDKLADAIDELYAACASKFSTDPWKLRESYADVLLNNYPVEDLIHNHLSAPIDDENMDNLVLLLEAQFERLRMHSSDAWFFFDFDSIEPMNSLRYAAHAVWLVKGATGIDLSLPLLPILENAHDDRSGLTGDAAFKKVLAQYLS